jgi:arylsulfatase A-like enzyme
MLPLLSGKAASIREEVFAEMTYHGHYEPQRCVRTSRYKYIKRYEPTAPGPYCGGGIAAKVWRRHGWEPSSWPVEALYDLVFDPSECSNLASDADHADTLEAMRSRLLAWQEETDDPILRGPIPPADRSPGATPRQRQPRRSSE